MNEVLDTIVMYLSLAMLGILVLFVVIGMLYGLGRGVKRASLRFFILGSLVLVVFFLTPLIAREILGMSVQIAGKTPNQWVDEYSDKLVQLLQEQFGDYVVSFQDYIKDYALGIVLALVNLVLFYVLFLVVKVVSWVIYAIVAHFAAPKRGHDGKKKKKRAGLGLLVGALQGVFLFIMLMVPVHGVISVVNNAAVYAAQAEESESSAQTTTQAVDENAEDSSDSNDVNAILKKVGSGLTLYSNIMKYSGLQFVSDKAFSYQLTVRVKNDKIDLVHDLNSGLELYVDSKEFMEVTKKLSHIYHDNQIDLTELDEHDYAVLRNFINKAFDLQILNVADQILGDLDHIFNTPYGDDLTLVDGTEDVYWHSIYGSLVQKRTTEREFTYDLAEGETAPSNYAQYATGLRAAVKYIADKKLNLLRNDIIGMIDFLEALDGYQITYGDPQKTGKLTEVMAEGSLNAQKLLDLAIAKTDDKPLMNVLGDHMAQLALVQMLGQPGFENLLLYSKTMDSQFANNPAMQDLADGMIVLFLGENAFTHTDANGVEIKGNWGILRNDLLSAAAVLRNYVTIMDDINEIKAELIADGTKESTAQTQAVLKYMARLAISEDDYEAGKDTLYAGKTYDEVKYQKVDQLVDAVYGILNDFPPLKTYLISQLKSGDDEGGYMKTLIDMIAGDESADNWKKTLHGIVDVANMMNNSKFGDLMFQFQSGEVDKEKLAGELFSAITEMKDDDVVKMVTTLIDTPEISNVANESLDDILNNAKNNTTLQETFKDATADEITEVRDKIDDLQEKLKAYSSNENLPEDAEEQKQLKEQQKEALETAIKNLWGTTDKLQNKTVTSGTGD